jgi:hypothetical protein
MLDTSMGDTASKTSCHLDAEECDTCERQGNEIRRRKDDTKQSQKKIRELQS